MTQTFNPRPVEPGAFRRWNKQALALFWRGMTVWALLFVVSDLVLLFASISMILSVFVQVFIFCLGIHLARQYDTNPAAGPIMQIAVLRSALRPALAMSLISTLISLVFQAIFQLMLRQDYFHTFGIDWVLIPAMARDDLMISAIHLAFIKTGVALIFTSLALHLYPMTQLLQYPAMVFTGAGWQLGRMLCKLGFHTGRNGLYMSGLGLGMMASSILVDNLFPYGVPLLLAYFACLVYVAFREIFMGRGENEPVPQKAAKASALAMSSPSA